MTRKLLLMLMTVGLPLLVLGQRSITGKVSDATTGEPLIGAIVVSKSDISLGTATDFDGNFVLQVPDNTTALLISYTGYETQEVTLDASNTVTVSLSEGQNLLKDVIVIGYGTVKREDATGSVQTVGASEFNRGAITSPQELLAGKVAGVSITSGGGGPDENASIRIRGESSLSAANDPLIVVDGVPLGGGVSGNRNFLNFINPNDIESMTVLKDASATAIYGSRASAGVVLITTKKGSAQKLRIDFNTNFSVAQPVSFIDVLSADEYRPVFEARFPNNVDLLGEANTDWQKEIYQNAIAHDHNLSATGKIGFLPFRVSVGYTDKDGILKTDNFKRYTGSINLNPSFMDNRLQFNVGLRSMLTQNQFADRGAIGSAVNFDPTQPVYDSESVYSGYFVWLGSNGRPQPLATANPVSLLNLRDDNSKVQRHVVNGSADYRFKFLPELRANLNLAYDYSNGSGSVNVPGENKVAFSYDPIYGGGVNNTYNAIATNALLEFYLNYKKSFGDHDIDLMGGYSWQRFYNDNSFKNNNAALSLPNPGEQDSIRSELYLLSLYSRLNYGFKNWLLVTLSLRSDATSRFAPENRWGLFPATAVAIKLLENNNTFFNSLKLRAGWGVTGQQDIGSRYVYQANYVISQNNARYQFGDEFINLFRPNGYDRNIKWEETSTVNLGVDMSIVKNRLAATLEVYQRNTKDLLVRVQVPAGTNLTNFINTNIGDMINRGVEFSVLASPIANNRVKWELNANVTYNDFEVTKLTASSDPNYPGLPVGGIAGGVGSTIQNHNVGYAPYSFYVYEQLYDENGNFLAGQYADRNGDGAVNDMDRYRYKKPFADFSFGLSSNLKVGNFDFSFGARANVGNYVYNNVATDLGHLARMWQTTNFTFNVHQSAIDNNIDNQVTNGQNIIFSDHFVQDASFLRFDHITLGYNFDNLIGNFLRIYATVQNPFVITKYTGIDPEIFGGIDNSFYPRPRTFLLGLNVSF
ncbi:MAG: SusC/RagA family TonB-linked outer membrane protein [Saprospiraceae bacterium]|nr:SusC/RagA family TonB-linked outer membrane protein [Saprospiraceae bacterium]